MYRRCRCTTPRPEVPNHRPAVWVGSGQVDRLVLACCMASTRVDGRVFGYIVDTPPDFNTVFIRWDRRRTIRPYKRRINHRRLNEWIPRRRVRDCGKITCVVDPCFEADEASGSQASSTSRFAYARCLLASAAGSVDKHRLWIYAFCLDCGEVKWRRGFIVSFTQSDSADVVSLAVAVAVMIQSENPPNNRCGLFTNYT